MATLRQLVLFVLAVGLVSAQDVIDRDYSDSRYDFICRCILKILAYLRGCMMKNDIFIAVYKILAALAL